MPTEVVMRRDAARMRPVPGRRGAVLLAALFLVTGAAAAAPDRSQDDDRPLDARLFAQGMEAARSGRRDEAGRILKRVSTEFPDSPFAPAALLKTAELLVPVTGWGQMGSASPQSVQQATDLLKTVAQKYRASREAPIALVRLGYLGFEPAGPRLNLDEACGRFATAAQIYADSEAADDALFGSGMCDLLRGRAARASEMFGRMLEEHPESPLAAEALYRQGVALSLLDDAPEAMLMLQRLRQRAPESRFAAQALDRLTLLHRMRLQPAVAAAGGGREGAPVSSEAPSSEGTPLYRPDPDYGAGPAAGGVDAQPIRGISDLSIDAQGLIVAASPKTPAVFRLDARGRIQERIDHPGPDHVAAAEGLAVFISGREQIAVNTRNWSGTDLRDADGHTPGDFGPIAVDALGIVHMVDRRENAVLIYDRARRLVGAVRPPAGRDGRFVDIAAGDEGGVYALDARARSVVVLAQGREVKRIDLTPLGAADPAALAVDGLGDLFVLDGGTGWIFVGDAQGKRLAVVKPSRLVTDRTGTITALEVDAQGRLYLAGRKSGAVVRLK
jgi:TolA-binding protein